MAISQKHDVTNSPWTQILNSVLQSLIYVILACEVNRILAVFKHGPLARIVPYNIRPLFSGRPYYLIHLLLHNCSGDDGR